MRYHVPADADLRKAVSRQQLMQRHQGDWRDAGQVVRYTVLPSLTDMPVAPKSDVRLDFDEPVLRPEGLTRGLALERTQAEAFQKYVEHLRNTSPNEPVYRTTVMQHLHYDMKPDPVVRRALMQRAVSFWRTTKNV